MTLVRIDTRYPDEVWNVGFNWEPAIGSANIISVEVKVGHGDFIINNISTESRITYFRVSGGTPNSQATVFLTASLDTGEVIGFNLLAPIDSR